jgi:hypothetical protein
MTAFPGGDSWAGLGPRWREATIEDSHRMADHQPSASPTKGGQA